MKLFILLIFCLACIQNKAQTAHTLTLKDSIMQKSKNQKTAAWIMLGGGAGLIVAGYAVPYRVNNSGTLNPIKPGLIIGGTLVMGSSYFLFHASANHKRQAMRIVMDTQQTILPVKGGWASSLQPALTLTIPLLQ